MRCSESNFDAPNGSTRSFACYFGTIVLNVICREVGENYVLASGHADLMKPTTDLAEKIQI